MNEVWSKNPALTRKLVQLWNQGMPIKNIAATLSNEFQVDITSSAAGGKVHRLKLKPRSVQGSNIKQKLHEQVSIPDKKVFFTPSLLPIPKSKFLDAPGKKTVKYSDKQ